ncbi:MAG: reverse transcriptase domain-containing protein [Bacillota bacterium]
MADGVVLDTEEGTPQGGPLSHLLANVKLEDVDREIQSRGQWFVKYADDCTIHFRSQRAGTMVMAGVHDFLQEWLRLKVNHANSDRPDKEEEVLGSSVTRPGMASESRWPPRPNGSGTRCGS